jgi:chemotaxis protein CheX
VHSVFINPFLKAAVNVLQTMAFTETQVGEPFLKGKTPLSEGDVTGIVGLTGDKNGSLAVSFSEAAILQVVSNMFGEACKEMNDEVRDAVGELTNMISGDARRILAEQGYQFQAAIPTVIDGKGHKICHAFPGPVLVIPFTVGEGGMCFMEVCFAESDSRRGVHESKSARVRVPNVQTHTLDD